MADSKIGEPPLVYCIVLTCGLEPDGRIKKLLCDTLDSVKKMTYPNFRIVVVDNGSIDGSQETVRTQFPETTLIENGKNLGFMEGSNVGLRYALAQPAGWALLLNNDISVDPAMLSEMMNVAIAHPDVGIIAPKIYYFSEPNILWYAGGLINYLAGIISHRGLRQEDRGQYDRIEETDYITGCAMLIKREVLETVGLLDPIYSPMYSEDADFSVRARRAGFKLMYVPRAKLWHKVSSFSGGGLTPLKTRLKVEHNLIFFKRYARWYHWITIPFCIAAVALLFVIKELLKGNVGIVSALFSGIVRALRSLFKSVSSPNVPTKNS